MKAIYKFHFDCGRQGMLEGIFVAEKEDVEILVEEGIEVYFGEVLGKHSEIYGPIQDVDLSFVTDSQDAVNVVLDLDLSTGFNPFSYTVTGSEADERNLGDDATVAEAIAHAKLNKKEGGDTIPEPADQAVPPAAGGSGLSG